MKKKYAIYVGGVVLVTVAILLIGWRRKAANVAASFIDTQEIGDNSGFSDIAFENMLRDTGWQGGEAWCMYFAKAIYIDSFPGKASQINRILTGSTQQSLRNAINNPDVFKVITDGRPKKGDIIIWQSIDSPAFGHAGIVYKHDSGDMWWTIEGNSGFGGTREGDGVAKSLRELVPGTIQGKLKLLAFLRLKT